MEVLTEKHARISVKMIREVRIMEKDHEPDGWPAVKMKFISELANTIENMLEERKRILKQRKNMLELTRF